MPSYLVESLITAITCAAAFGFAGLAYRRQRFGWALLGILIGGLALRLFAGADQYLHTWDEKFHALVAKNLLEHPLRPTLIDNPVLPYDHRAWYSNHIWLHKPPLPLWLMAGSIGLFGATDWAVRLPSLLLSLLAIFVTFRMGKALFDTRVGLLAAFLHAVNGKLIELAAGRDSSDHVETCHVVMFQLAMWWVVRNWQQRDHRSALLAGVFTGLAFLSKWTPAAFIPLIWFLGALWQQQPFRELLRHGLLLGVFALIVGVPWVGYIAVYYPEESRSLWEGVLRAQHDIVETHGGPWYFYLDRMRILFGELVYLPLLAGLLVLYRAPHRKGLFVLALWIAVPLLAFSAASTKRDTYLLVTAPAFFLLTAWAIRLLLRFRWRQVRGRWVYTVLAALFLLLPLRYGVERTKLFVARERRPGWVDDIGAYRRQITASPEQAVIFGLEHNIEMMYYTGITAYSVTPAAEVLAQLKHSGYRVYLLQGNTLKEY